MKRATSVVGGMVTGLVVGAFLLLIVGIAVVATVFATGGAAVVPGVYSASNAVGHGMPYVAFDPNPIGMAVVLVLSALAGGALVDAVDRRRAVRAH